VILDFGFGILDLGFWIVGDLVIDSFVHLFICSFLFQK